MSSRLDKIPVLYFVLPCFNEEDNIFEMTSLLTSKIDLLIENKTINKKSSILFVDDGSNDNTWKLITKKSKENNYVKGLRLNRNYGQQIAIYAGLLESSEISDIVISLDADGQHDLAIIEEMIKKYLDGNDIVCAIRSNRNEESFFKKLFVIAYYSLLSLLGIKSMRNHADYRLLSKEAIISLRDLPKRLIYLRGDILKLPFNKKSITYECNKRMHGESKYSIIKNFKLALDGICIQGYIPILKIIIASLLFFLLGALLRNSDSLSIFTYISFIIGGALSIFSLIVLIHLASHKSVDFEVKERI